ncbi:31378_t:CDS:2, partial [Gigaspora margarita]
MATTQEKFCFLLLEEVSEIEKKCDFTTWQLPNLKGVSANSRLPITTVFENISDPVNSPVLRNFNVVYDQIHTIECSDYDSEQTICFRWQIEKQWCITQFSRDNTTGFVQFNTGFYWFVTVNNLNEPLRHLKYMSDENESTRYAVGSEFKPERDDGHLRGPCAIDLNVNNAQAIRDLGEEIRDLKKKLVEDKEERDNKSCPICKKELKENEIEKHLKEHIKNPLSKETI